LRSEIFRGEPGLLGDPREHLGSDLLVVVETDAKKEYAMYLRDDKQNKPGSVEDTTYRLGLFFSEVDETGQVVRGLDEVALSSITSTKGEELYAGLRRRKTKTGKRLAVDSHRYVLAEARSFLKWCMGKRWIVRNPLDGVEGVGRRRHGKEQLRIDEARRWQAKAIEFADQGKEGAVAAMMCLSMGMRCSEVVNRVVRDLDDEGRLLWSAPEVVLSTYSGLRRRGVMHRKMWSLPNPPRRPVARRGHRRFEAVF
jgi:site-specific recombinase XerD